MMIRKRSIAALLAFGTLAGCKQQLYMTTDDQHLVQSLGLPSDPQTKPELTAPPTGEQYHKPPTIDQLNQEVRYLTLPEAMAMALENGNRGNASASGSTALLVGSGRSVVNDDLVTFTGRGIAGDDSIRAFALDPAITGADIEGALSKFDARLLTSMTWNKQDNAVANTFNNLSNGDQATFNSGLYKPLPTGGLAGITFNTGYTKLSAPPQGFQVINPAYTPAVGVNFEQPLLRDYGIEINQLLPQHPGSTQVAGLNTSTTRSEGILITRIRYDQAKHEFNREVNVMLANVEFAYWSLYAAYYALYASDQGTRQSYITWQLTKAQLEAGTKSLYEVAQVRAQFERFRSDRINALQSVLDAERNLRGILNLPVQDGKRFIPADAPTLAPYNPDWSSAVNESLAMRPELQLIREEVKARQLDVLLQQNNTRPDLRFFANYNVNAIGTKLDGSGSNNALAGISDNSFNTWAMGFRLNYALGTRDAHASLRVSQLNLARNLIVLKNQEEKAERFLAGVYQTLFQTYRVIEYQRARRIALAEQLEGLFARFKVGKDPLLNLLVAQSDFADAIRLEHAAIANYNIAIASLQYAKGTIQEYNNVKISDGPLPHCALERATDHHRARTAGIVLRERATMPSGDGPYPLPALLEHQPPTPTSLPDEGKLFGSKTPLDPMAGPGTPMPRTLPEATLTSSPAPLGNLPPTRPLPGGK